MPNDQLTLESGAKALKQAGPVWALVIVSIGLLVYIGIDKLAMADRWTGSQQQEYAKEVRATFKEHEARLRNVEMKHAELMGKVDALATAMAQVTAAIGELRGLLLRHQSDEAAAAVRASQPNQPGR